MLIHLIYLFIFNTMILYPPAKINIGLNIIEKRADGYHELETVMMPIPVYDVLEIIQSEQFEWKQSGAPVDGNEADNLCVKAFRLIQSIYGVGNVYMHLRKQIPMGAGLGGGSADAAYVIRGLNELFALNISIKKQQELAGQLGSDCPFFIGNSAQLATGRGEQLKTIHLDLSGYHLIVVKPSIHVNTRQAYSGVYISGDHGKLEQQLSQPIATWKQHIKNDFEEHLFLLYPELSEIKKSLYEAGAVYASMSGSGSALFGIFETVPNYIPFGECDVFRSVL